MVGTELTNRNQIWNARKDVYVYIHVLYVHCKKVHGILSAWVQILDPHKINIVTNSNKLLVLRCHAQQNIFVCCHICMKKYVLPIKKLIVRKVIPLGVPA